MAVISVTRLQLRSLRYVPLFMWHVYASTRQVRHARGFLGGQLANEGTKGFWTITAWRDEAAMRAHFRSAAYGRYVDEVADLLARPSDVVVHTVSATVHPVGDLSLEPRRAG